MSKQWAKKFKSKEEHAVELIDTELASLAVTIAANHKIMLAGAPGMSLQAVHTLKSATHKAQQRTGVLERQREKLTAQATGRNK